MQLSEIEKEIYSEVDSIGLPIDFELVLKGYSNSYCGLYDPEIQRITVYILEEDGELICKDEYMDTVIHEVIHHYQWQYTNYVRKKGVMHNPEFHKLFNHYYKKWRIKYGSNKKDIGLCL